MFVELSGRRAVSLSFVRLASRVSIRLIVLLLVLHAAAVWLRLARRHWLASLQCVHRSDDVIRLRAA